MTRVGITTGLAALLAILIVVSAPAFGQDAEEPIKEQSGTAYVPGEVVVAREDGTYAVRQVQAETLGGIQEKAEEIEEAKDIIAAGPNYAYKLFYAPNDPLFDQQYNLAPAIRARGAWDYSRGEGVSIGFVDTGYDGDHPDLDSKARGEYDFVGEDPVAQDSGYHGTAVVGVAAAETDNQGGIASAGFEAGFFMAKGCTDVCLSSDTAAALDWLVDRGVKIINLSFGAEQEPPGDEVLGLAVQRAQKAGALVIAAVGNDGVNTDSFYPAAYPGVLGVAAIDQDQAPASFTNSGPVVDVAAPGVDIISTYNEHYSGNETGALYARFRGTSYAAPHVAGVAALIKARNSDLTAAQIDARIRNTAVDLGEPGRDDAYGYGLLGARCAVAPRLDNC
jgi:thermitase